MEKENSFILTYPNANGNDAVSACFFCVCVCGFFLASNMHHISPGFPKLICGKNKIFNWSEKAGCVAGHCREL